MIPAAAASLAVVVRRGPTDWQNISLWDIAAGTITIGAWTNERFYAGRSALSPDGRWFIYLACGGGSALPPSPPAPPVPASVRNTPFDPHGFWPNAYTAVSRPPWLFAQMAWKEIGTYTPGACFTSDTTKWALGDPFQGLELRSRLGYGIEVLPSQQLKRELARGWTRAKDENGAAILSKSQPGGPLMLRARISSSPKLPEYFEIPKYTRTDAAAPLSVRYEIINADGRAIERRDLAWADWSGDGRLIGVPRGGDGTVVSEVLDPIGEVLARTELRDLVDLKPEPSEAPAWARE